MHLLLVSATAFEIRETAHWLTTLSATHNIPDTELLISGIGQLQTAYALQKKIMFRRPELIVQAGFGGGPNQGDIGKAYAIHSETLSDLGALDKEGFHDLFELGLEKSDQFPFRKGKLENPYRKLLDWCGLPVLDGHTVNEIKSSDSKSFQRNELPVVESMEGAALHFVCLMEKIPFLQIRAVSNVTGDRDKSRWKIPEAQHILHQTLSSLLQKLNTSDETLFRI